MANRWRGDGGWDQPRGPKGNRLIVWAGVAVLVYGLGIGTGAVIAQSNSATVGFSGNLPGTAGSEAQGAPSSPAQSLPPQSGGSTGGTSTDLSPTLDSGIIARIYKQSIPSIVTITAVTDSKTSGPSEDIGTGFFINNQGDIATNAHVVNGQKTVTVTLAGKDYKGQVVGADTMDDLAIVHITPPSGVQPLPLGTAKTLVPGDMVIAIGNPFQLTGSVSAGIVSGLNRSMPTQNGRVMSGLVQTDAALNPGNSGGPLLNDRGQVVGIDTAIESPVQGSVGIGFAIPIDRLIRLLPTLLQGQTVTHPWLGIEALDLSPALAQQAKLPVSQGVLVMSTVPGSPAAKAGIRGDSGTSTNPKYDGDIIIAVDGSPVSDVASLTADISQDPIGSVVKLTILRNGQQMNVNVTLAPWPKTLPGSTNNAP